MPKNTKWNRPDGGNLAGAATEMQSRAAAQSTVPLAPGVRITRVHKQTPSNHELALDSGSAPKKD